MDIETHKYITIRMHESEAEKFQMLLHEVYNCRDDNLPTWVKAQAEELQQKLERAGIK